MSAYISQARGHDYSSDTRLTVLSFYNFPSHYYKEKFPNVGSKELAEQVITLLKSNGIAASPVSRGLDHGVWSCFKVGEHLLDYPSTIVLQRLEDSLAFDPETNPLNVPIVQVSLFGSEDPYQHYHLGKAVFALREQNVQIIVSGMAVHNLRERRLAAGSQKPMPYTVSFDEALKDAMTGSVNGREERMAQLLKRPDAKQAHPTFEHLIPAFVGAGAAGEDEAKRLWTLKEGGMSWAQFRFGEVTAS